MRAHGDAEAAKLEDGYPLGMLGHQSQRKSYKTLMNEISAAGALEAPDITVAAFGPIAGGNEEFARLFKEETGGQVNFVLLSHADMLSEMAEMKADVLYLGWKSVFLDPETNLTPFDFIRSIQEGPRKSEFIKLRKIANQAVLNDERVRAYGRIADLIFHEALYLPVSQHDELQALRKGLSFSDAVYRYSPMLSDLQITQ